MDYILSQISQLDAQASGSSWSGHTLVVLTFKALLVIALAACFAWVFRRAAASRRHAGWLAATVLLVTLPIATVALPKWALPLLPAESIETVDRAATGIANSSLPPLAAGAMADWSTNDAPMSSWWSRFAIAGWALGASLVLSRAAVGLVRLHRLRRGAEEVKDPEWQLNLAKAKEQTSVSRAVCLLKSTEVRTPITWGLHRIYICLPTHADQWETNSRQVVLNHELTHARRGDWLWHWLTIAMTAVHWFNPLAWWAAHRLRTEAEIACDDAVIGQGCAPSEYADCRYQMVRAAKATPLHANAAMPMARPSELPTRLARILNDRTSRHETSFRTLLLTLAVSVTLGSVIAAAQVVRAHVQAKPFAESDSEKSVTNTHDAVTGWNRDDSTLIENEREVRNEIRTWLDNASYTGALSRDEAERAFEFYRFLQSVEAGEVTREDVPRRLEQMEISWQQGEELLARARRATKEDSNWNDQESLDAPSDNRHAEAELRDDRSQVSMSYRNWFLQNGTPEADLERFERALAESGMGRQQVGETMQIVLRILSMNEDGGSFEVHPAILTHMTDQMRLTDDQIRLVQGIAQRIAGRN